MDLTDTIIIYDLDGTLAWTEKYWLPVLDEVLISVREEFGRKPALEQTSDVLNFLGDPVEEIFARLYPDASASEISDILKLKGEIWSGLLMSHPFQLYDGVLSTLREFQQQGAGQFISSNCDDVYLQRMLKTTGLREVISGSVCLGHYPGQSKARFTRHLLERVGGWQRGYFVGDTRHDMEAGRENGLQTVFAEYGYGTAEAEFIDHRIDTIQGLSDVIVG